MVDDRKALELTESDADAERLFIENFDAWDMIGYYLYSKLWRAGVSAHIGTGGIAAGHNNYSYRLYPDYDHQLGGINANIIDPSVEWIRRVIIAKP